MLVFFHAKFLNFLAQKIFNAFIFASNFSFQICQRIDLNLFFLQKLINFFSFLQLFVLLVQFGQQVPILFVQILIALNYIFVVSNSQRCRKAQLLLLLCFSQTLVKLVLHVLQFSLKSHFLVLFFIKLQSHPFQFVFSFRKSFSHNKSLLSQLALKFGFLFFRLNQQQELRVLILFQISLQNLIFVLQRLNLSFVG